MYKKELQISQQAAKKAGQFLKKEFFAWDNNWDNKKIKYKTGKERVTWCDKKAEQIILDILNKNFPSYSRLSEESGIKDKDSDYEWIVDPLDGTSNFTTHHPYFAVAIALSYKNEVVISVVYDIVLDEMYWAVKDNGAYRNNKKISVSKNTILKKSLISYTHGSTVAETKKAFKLYEHFHLKAQKCRNFACTSLQMAQTAAGYNEVFISLGPKIWDVAAGALLIKEAGGIVTGTQNKAWNTKSKSIVAGNKLHNKVLKDLKKLKLT